MVKRAAVDSDPDGLVVSQRDFYHRAKVFIKGLAVADIAGVYSVFIQFPGNLGILSQKQMAVKMKVTDNRGCVTPGPQIPDNGFDCPGGGIIIYGNADNLAPGLDKLFTLQNCFFDIRG
ncbi:hypothetical protein LDC_1653 [sediment metagenome]|uniref:Uncharacterized protein n=1 Tax=sediment metagenome TaxID=749907 RepID=D9PJE4_9ZZZZ